MLELAPQVLPKGQPVSFELQDAYIICRHNNQTLQADTKVRDCTASRHSPVQD